MKPAARLVIRLLAAALVALPPAVLLTLTLALIPFWSWLEAATGIESIGHSGPAGWCYAVMIVAVFVAVAVPLIVRDCRRRRAALLARPATP